MSSDRYNEKNKYKNFKQLIKAYKMGKLKEPMLVAIEYGQVIVDGKEVFHFEGTESFVEFANAMGIPCRYYEDDEEY